MIFVSTSDTIETIDMFALSSIVDELTVDSLAKNGLFGPAAIYLLLVQCIAML